MEESLSTTEKLSLYLLGHQTEILHSLSATGTLRVIRLFEEPCIHFLNLFRLLVTDDQSLWENRD